MCLDMLNDTDVELLVSMANDKSVTVRQKVVQLLSRCLEREDTSSQVFLTLAR